MQREKRKGNRQRYRKKGSKSLKQRLKKRLSMKERCRNNEEEKKKGEETG